MELTVRATCYVFVPMVHAACDDTGVYSTVSLVSRLCVVSVYSPYAPDYLPPSAPASAFFYKAKG